MDQTRFTLPVLAHKNEAAHALVDGRVLDPIDAGPTTSPPGPMSEIFIDYEA